MVTSGCAWDACLSFRAMAPCPNCGYTGNELFNTEYLPPDTPLTERYIVGRQISCNGGESVYIGYDLSGDRKVVIHEYMPRSFVTRDKQNYSLLVNPGFVVQYKAIKEDFTELANAIKELGLNFNGIVPVLDVFEHNNTVYSIEEYIDAKPLSDILRDCGGKMSWPVVKKMFVPFLGVLSKIHRHGVIHRGISPATILVDDAGTMWFSQFCVPPVRTDRSELESELFDGYSAPEQYSLNSWQGTWTDVYGIAAVIYNPAHGSNSDGCGKP